MMRRIASHFLTFASVLCVLAGSSFMAHAEFIKDDGAPPAPQTLTELQYIERQAVGVFEEENNLTLDIRNDAMREAALSYGARGGLTWRTFYIRREMEERAIYMDDVFNFSSLLIPAPSGLLIEPPVISESINSMIINTSGTEAAVSDRIYDINANARIVATSRSWRNYLEREWGTVTEPPDILRPKNLEEREEWVRWVSEGWDKGVEQANEIFQDDLNELVADYRGMVRYRMLLSQGMVTPPYALQVDRGVTGGGNNMRVGDRAVQITGMPALVSGAEKWQPANR